MLSTFLPHFSTITASTLTYSSLPVGRGQNEVLVHNVSGGVIISNQSLVLQKVVRAQAGRYSCQAHNLVGDASSNSLRLDVKCEYPSVKGCYCDGGCTVHVDRLLVWMGCQCG